MLSSHFGWYIRNIIWGSSSFYPRHLNKLQERCLQLDYNTFVLYIIKFTVNRSSSHRKYNQTLKRLKINRKKCPTLYDERHCIYELPSLPNNTATKHVDTNRERCEILTGYLSLGCRPGGEWMNNWHWTKVSKFDMLIVPTDAKE